MGAGSRTRRGGCLLSVSCRLQAGMERGPLRLCRPPFSSRLVPPLSSRSVARAGLGLPALSMTPQPRTLGGRWAPLQPYVGPSSLDLLLQGWRQWWGTAVGPPPPAC